MRKRYHQIIILTRVSAYCGTMKSAFPTGLKRERRRSRRTSVLVPAMVVVGENNPFPARVLNLSTTGALLESRADLDPGELVTFTCGTIKSIATVVWCAGDALGVTFPGDLDPDDVRRQVDRTAALHAHLQRHTNPSPVEQPNENVA